MDSVREFHRLEEALRQGKKIQGGGSDVCPLRPGFAICGQTGVGKSSAIAALYLAHLLTPEEYEEYQQDVRCWEDLECEQTLRALSMDNMSTRQITMPMRLYTDATLQFSQKASNMVLGDLQVFHNYGLPNQTYSAPRLDLPSIGGTGNVGSTLPAALSFGSEPQLLVIFMSEEELVDQLLLYLSYVGQQTLGKRNKDEVQAFKQLWDAVVKDEARDEQGQARLKMTVESMGQQYKPPLKPIVHEALGTSHLFRTRREGCKPDLYAELHFISLVQQLLMKRDAVERLRPSHRMCVELLKEEAKDGLWADCHGASELLAIQACVKVLDLFVPSHLLHAFNTKLEDSIGAGDGVKMRVQRQNAKEAVLDNMVVMLDRVLEGSDTVQKYLELSPFIQRWIRAGIHGCIGTPPQLAFMFIPERLDGLLNWEDAEDYYKYSKEGDRSNGSLLNAANVREFHEYLEKEVLAEKVATIRDNVRELFAKMIHTAEPDLSDNQRRDHVERLLQKVTIFYCLPFLGTMALHQLTSAGQHGQAFVKGFTHEHLENILCFSQLSTLMAILAGPWIRKKDEMYSKIRETADDEIRQAQERVATIDFMTARVMKISLKKKWSKASRELQNNLFGTDSNCMKEIQSGQRRCVSWLERRLQCLIPDWKDVESNTRRTLNRNYGLERLKVNERDLLEEYLRPEHELEHPCLPVARVLREEVASLVDALLRSELKPLILELHDHLKGMMTGPVTQTFQTYFCDDPGQYDTLKDILEPHLQSQLSRLLTRSNVRIKLDADTVKSEIASKLQQETSRRTFTSPKKINLFQLLINGDPQPFGWHAREACSSILRTRLGQANPQLESLINQIDDFLRRALYKPAMEGKAHGRPKGIKDIVFMFRDYGTTHKTALEDAREEYRIITEKAAEIDQIDCMQSDEQVVARVQKEDPSVGYIWRDVLGKARPMISAWGASEVVVEARPQLQQGAREQQLKVPDEQPVWVTRVRGAQMRSFWQFLEQHNLELVDNPSNNNKCGFYAVLGQVTGTNTDDPASWDEEVETMVDRVSDVISNDIEALRAEPSRIPSETLANIASDHSASANMEDTATVIQLAVDHVQGLRGTAPVTNTDLVILVDLLQRDGRGDNLTLDIYKPDFTSFRYSLHDAPGSIAIANVWTTWVVHHVAGLSLPDASGGPLNHFMMVKPKNALKPSGPHSAKRQKHI